MGALLSWNQREQMETSENEECSLSGLCKLIWVHTGTEQKGSTCVGGNSQWVGAARGGCDKSWVYPNLDMRVGQKSWSTTRRSFSPKSVPDNCRARQLLHFRFVTFSGLSFRNGITPNMSSVSVYEEIMRVAGVRIYYQACVYLSSHRIPVCRFMAESPSKNIA